MMGGGILGGVLGSLALVDSMRRRGRARALQVLEASEEEISPEHLFVARPGVVLDEATRRAASAHARKHGLTVLDLISPTLDSWRVFLLLGKVDPARFRNERVTQGMSAGDALLVHRDVLARAVAGGKVSAEPKDAPALTKLGEVLKLYAPGETDLAVAPALDPPTLSRQELRRLLQVIYGDLAGYFVAVQVGLLGAALAGSPIWGSFAVASRHLEMVITTAGTPLRPRDRAKYTFFRSLLDLANTFGPASERPGDAPKVDDLRDTYRELLADGTSKFFEPPREDCPLCGGRALTKMFEIGDRHLGKPGRFALVRCDDCEHTFQNPRLTVEGLSFYYRDVYDGLGEDTLAGLFAQNPEQYRVRARMVAEIGKPRRWLEVGAGHAHFCCAAREVLPDTTFDGLDLGAAIEDAERRGWVEHGIRGLFVDMAAKLEKEAHRYDVVSMSHYLEHTLDPRAEIAAAARVLPEGGLFFIEVPDPESGFAKLLGRHWSPWLQPQHLHFLTAKNLERLLREEGFQPLAWHRGEAHQPHDFASTIYMACASLVQPAERPWLRPSGILGKVGRTAFWTASLPPMLTALVLDHAVAPLARRPGWANAYRVVARRVGSSASDKVGLNGVHAAAPTT